MIDAPTSQKTGHRRRGAESRPDVAMAESVAANDAIETLRGSVFVGDAVAAEIVKAPKRRVRPKTRLGRAFLANGPVIVIQAQSMISIVELEIARLLDQKQNLRLNHPAGNAEFDSTIANLNALKRGLVSLQKAATDFSAGTAVEGKLAGVLKEIAAPFREFWKKDGAKRVGETAKMGLTCGGYLLATHLGMTVPTATVITGAIFAHKEISEVLRAGLGKMFGGPS